MTGVLDLMHAFSYAYRAAAVLDDPNTYRRQGLPLTSSHIESAIKQINARVKGTGKFWRNDHANAILQLRADTLSDSQPQKYFWTRWRANQTEVNQYPTIAPETNNIPENAPGTWGTHDALSFDGSKLGCVDPANP